MNKRIAQVNVRALVIWLTNLKPGKSEHPTILDWVGCACVEKTITQEERPGI